MGQAAARGGTSAVGSFDAGLCLPFHQRKSVGAEPQIDDNLHHYDFIAYDRYVGRYAAAIVHGGTGVVYSCLKAAIPMLVWPHDYDQFDHAARIIFHRLGLQCRPSPAKMEADLRCLMGDTGICAALGRIRKLLDECRPHESFAAMLTQIERVPYAARRFRPRQRQQAGSGAAEHAGHDGSGTAVMPEDAP